MNYGFVIIERGIFMKKAKQVIVLLLISILITAIFSGCKTFKTTDEAIAKLSGVWCDIDGNNEFIIDENGKLIFADTYQGIVIGVFQNEVAALINSQNSSIDLSEFKDISYSAWKDKVEKKLSENDNIKKISYDLEKDSFEAKKAQLYRYTFKYKSSKLYAYDKDNPKELKGKYTKAENTTAEEFYKNAFEEEVEKSEHGEILISSKQTPVEFRKSLNGVGFGEYDYIDSHDEKGITLFSSKTIKNDNFGKSKFGSDCIYLREDDDGTVRIEISNMVSSSYFQKNDAIELAQLWIDSYADFLKLDVREMVDFAENNNGEDSRNPFIKLEYSYTENKNAYGNITGYNVSIRITNNGVTINDINKYANQLNN